MMAAYQCLNCHRIERSDEQCCDNPDLFCINDMPEAIKYLQLQERRLKDVKVIAFVSLFFNCALIALVNYLLWKGVY